MAFWGGFIPFFVDNAAWASFIGSLTIGEEVLIFLATVAGRGLIPFWKVFLYGFLGSLAGDLIWFYIGKSAIIGYLKKIKFLNNTYNNSKPMIKKIGLHKLSGWRCFVYFGSTKFLGVMKVLAAIYVGRRGMSLKRFLSWNIPALVIWMGIMLTAAWMAGRGFTIMLKILESAQKALFATIVLVIILYLGIKWVADLIVKRSLKKR